MTGGVSASVIGSLPAGPSFRRPGCVSPRPLLEACPLVISKTIVLAACRFDERFGAERVAAAIGKGLRAGGWPEPDLLAIIGEPGPGSPVRELLDELDFDARMRR